MKPKVNIFTDEWCDIIFKDKNKDYGAFALRKSSSKNHLVAIIVTGVLFSISVSFPLLIKGSDSNDTMNIGDITTLTNVDMDNKIEIPEPMKAEIPKMPVFRPWVVAPDDQAGDDDIISMDSLNLIQLPYNPNNDTIGFKDLDKNDKDKKIIIEKQKPFIFVEKMPEYPGGESEMMSFLNKNIVYPQDAREMNVQGTVYATFVVNADGSVSNIQILRGVFASCDKEALRVIKMMPNWKPGKQNGVAVPVQLNLPIAYVLK
jgi:protein TonB